LAKIHPYAIKKRTGLFQAVAILRYEIALVHYITFCIHREHGGQKN